MADISFIICTIQKEKEDIYLNHVIDNIKKQENVEIEIILVWDGLDINKSPNIEGVKKITLDFSSLSEKRNIGAASATAPVICFLDDDTYPSDTLFARKAIDLLISDNIDFLTCNIESTGQFMSGGGITADADMNYKTIIPNMWEPGLTIYANVFNRLKLDPTLGIGCVHGASEGFDLGFRLLKDGKKGRRISSFYINHPPLDPRGDYQAERFFFYSLGNGAVLIQHKYYWTFTWQIIKTIARLFVSVVKLDFVRVRASFIRILCMLIGPLLPRRRGRVLPSWFIADHSGI